MHHIFPMLEWRQHVFGFLPGTSHLPRRASGMTHLCLEGLEQSNGSWGQPCLSPTWPSVPVSQEGLFHFSCSKSFLFDGEGGVVQVLFYNILSVLQTLSADLIFSLLLRMGFRKSLPLSLGLSMSGRWDIP